MSSTDTEIKDKLGLKRWTISCQRLKEYLDGNNLGIREIELVISSDNKFLKRKKRVKRVGIEVRSVGRSSFCRYAEYAICKGECIECRNRIKCAMKEITYIS